MTLSDFNSKINLPFYVRQELKLKNIEFKKIPTRGWFATTADHGIVGNIFELVEPEEVKHLYKKMTQERREFLESPLVYNPSIEETLYKNYLTYITNLMLYQDAVENTGAKMRGAAQQSIQKYCRMQGMDGLLINNLGFLDIEFLKRRGRGDLTHYAPCLLIPTWHAPGHLSSLEAAKVDSVDDTKMLWYSGEKGWYGTIGDTLINSVSDLRNTQGFTWSKEADYWTTEVVKLPANLQIHNIVKIWREAKLTTFETPLLDHLLSYYDEDQVLEQISLFSREQIKAVEERAGWKLEKAWLANKSGSCILANSVYTRRDNKYYHTGYGAEHEITNFAIDLTSIRSEHPILWSGIICYEDRSFPFELPGKKFANPQRFMDVIYDLFVEAKFGMPYVHPTHKKYLLEIVKKMNPAVEII